jgi:hypothetical protein
MKKLTVVAIMALVGSVAFASTLSVPWFVDNASPNTGVPSTADGTCGIVTLHNNLSTNITCAIAYYTQNGASIGPSPAAGNTFVVPALSSVAFRPYMDDPSAAETPLGQESEVARAIPNRPRGTENGNDNKKNGSLVISWVGNAQAVQGTCALYGKVTQEGQKFVNTFGHLLPPGMSQ